MKHNCLIGLMTIGMIGLAIAEEAALAGETKVQTAKVEAISSPERGVLVKAGDTVVRLPQRSTSYRYWNPWRSWNLPWGNWRSHNNSCRHRSSQTTRTTSGGIVQRSSSSQVCN